MNSRPLVSVLIPCYNSLKTIDRTLQSVLSQTYTNIEVIISDDCSTDDTYHFLTKNYGNNRGILLSQNPKNLGMCGNWNKLFAKATGMYWLKLDADDIISPDFIEKTVKKAIETDADFTGSSYQFLDINKGEPSKVYIHQKMGEGFLDNPLASIFIDYPFHLCFTLLKAEFVKKISSEYYFMETEVGDAEFQIRAALFPGFKAYFIKEELGFYCFHGNNSSLTPLKQAKSFLYDVIKKHHQSLDEKLNYAFHHKMRANFKQYLKSMLLGRAPWDMKLLLTCFRFTY